MSFYNDPIVDDNTKLSEESVHMVKGLFTKRNGFIVREEWPDFGVDLDVELIVANSGASSQKFPVQIKSTIAVHKVNSNGITLISLEFKTSRLGYLAKRIPAYGIIALFDDTAQICYFDYVDAIIKRLDEHPKREGWREQEQVNILLPLQVLNQDVLPELHQKFLLRHQNSELMLNEHGQEYGIPAFGIKRQASENGVNLEDPEEIAHFLETFGSQLYNAGEYAALNRLLDMIARERLNGSAQLVFLAAVTYTRIGNIIDAEYYIRKAKRMPEIMQSEGAGLLEYSTARIEFMKGNFDYTYFLNEFRRIVDNAENLEDKLTLKINILFFEMTKGLMTGTFSPDFETQLTSLQKEIEAADMSDTKKQSLRCHHADCQFHFAVKGDAALYQELKFKQMLNVPVPTDDIRRRLTHFLDMIGAAERTVYDVYVYGCNHNLSLLKTTAAHQMGQHFLARQSNFLFMDYHNAVPQDKQKQIELYAKYQRFSLLAYDGFLLLNMYQNAHEALLTAYEINQLCVYLTQVSIGPKKADDLLDIIRHIEGRFDLQPFESGMARFIERHGQIAR